jgi:hypothetical protein
MEAAALLFAGERGVGLGVAEDRLELFLIAGGELAGLCVEVESVPRDRRFGLLLRCELGAVVHRVRQALVEGELRDRADRWTLRRRIRTARDETGDEQRAGDRETKPRHGRDASGSREGSKSTAVASQPAAAGGGLSSEIREDAVGAG